MSFSDIRCIKHKYSIIFLFASVLLSLTCIILFSNKSKLAIEAMAVSPDEQYIAYFITGDGYKIVCAYTDGTQAFEFDVLPDMSAGGYCALWFDENSLYASFYRTDKIVQWALDGTVLDITEFIGNEYPPEFPLFTRTKNRYVFCGTQIDVVYNAQSFVGYWFQNAERYVAVAPKNEEMNIVCAWSAKDGIIQTASQKTESDSLSRP